MSKGLTPKPDIPLSSFKKALEEYDKKYATLIDYFGVIGPPIHEIYAAIEAAKNGQKTKLSPHVLTRVPEIDKPSISFPGQIADVCYIIFIMGFSFAHQDP